MASPYLKMQKGLPGDLFAGLDPSVALGILPQTNFVEMAPTSGVAMPTSAPQMPPIKSIQVGGSMNMPRMPDSLESQIESQYQSNMSARNQGISDYDAKVKALSAKKDGLANLDLSGVAALADAWGGNSNFAGVYKRPENAKDRAAQIAQLEELKKKAQGELGDDQLAYLKSKMDERKQDAYMKLMAERSQNAQERGDNNVEFKLRSEYQNSPIFKSAISMDDHYRRITGVDANSSQGQMALIFGFMKMLDDGSVVRESEYANAAKSGGLYSRAAQLGEQLKNGKVLGPEVVAEFKNATEDIMREVRAKKEALDQRYNDLSQRKGIAKEDIVWSGGMKEPTKTKAPAGMVRVSNGRETREIPQGLLQQATASGAWKQTE